MVVALAGVVGLAIQPAIAAPGQAADANSPAIAAPQASLSAVGGEPHQVTLGSTDETTGFKFQVELDSRGAGLRQATLNSEWKDLNQKGHPPLVLLEPARTDASSVLSLANRQMVLVDQRLQLSLDALNWKTVGSEPNQADSQSARFEAVITDGQDRPVLRLTKTYTVTKGSHLLDCLIDVENLSKEPHTVYFSLEGPAGIRRESILADLPKAVAAFRDARGQISSHKLDFRTTFRAKDRASRQLRVKDPQARMLWAGITDKYFAAVLVPESDPNRIPADWLGNTAATAFNPDGDAAQNSGDETVGLDCQTLPVALSAAGDPNASRAYHLKLYLGPKDKGLFDKDPLFSQLGFVHTIDFGACCCPCGLITPLAFLILAVMKAMHVVLFNYGVVIIVLVLLMRLVMHPITKKSQIAMSKMSKLAPKTEELKKKYANNKTELNKQLMALYKEQGASPVMGFLPMMLQMPIWFALWSAVNSSIDLRGQPFLPFWITDLSAPDALIHLSGVYTVPLLGVKLAGINLLPILMGVAFYLQQKLTPTPTAATNPQIAQQQKMMMWMMPVLFPIMFYNTASGVNLYIMTSTFAGVWEQKIILRHIQEKEQTESEGLVAVTSKTGGKVKKKKPKPLFKF
jgi:YidC/Oxa1 family membrane protein insertase